MTRIKAEDGERQVGLAGKRTRRKWAVAEKVRIVRELEASEVAVSEVARRHGAHTSMLTRWRAQYRAGELGRRVPMTGGARLVSVRVKRNEPVSSEPAREPAPVADVAGGIEVQLTSGQRVWIRGTVDAGMLRAVLAEL